MHMNILKPTKAEMAWRQETGPIRELYRGILQVSVAYYHLLHKNYAGARKCSNAATNARTFSRPVPGNRFGRFP